MLVLAVTIHNFPEGMAVGIVFAALFNGHSTITMASAFALSLGIAIQNFPEGAIISMPLKASGASKMKSFIYGTLSGGGRTYGRFVNNFFLKKCVYRDFSGQIR